MQTKVTIGRAEGNLIRLREDCGFASSNHAVIYSDGNQLMYSDTSTNGTLINGQLIKGATIPINRGDNIMIASRYPLGWDLIDQYFPVVAPQPQQPAPQPRPIPQLAPQPQPQPAPQPAPKPVQQPQPQPAPQPEPKPQPQQPAQQPQPSLYGKRPQSQPAPQSQPQPQPKPQLAQRPQPQPRPVPRPVQPPQPRPQQSAPAGGSLADPNLTKWSWGAFGLSWIWGFFNGCWWILLVYVGICILSLIPFVSFISGAGALAFNIYLGMKGRRLSWKNRVWPSAAEFEKTQKTWDKVGLILFIVAIVLTLILTICMIAFGASLMEAMR